MAVNFPDTLRNWKWLTLKNYDSERLKNFSNRSMHTRFGIALHDQ